MAWNLRTFTTDAGGKPVEEWIRSLDTSAQVSVIRVMRHLREFGIEAGMPHVRSVGEGLWELRAKDEDGIYRVLYFHLRGRTFALLHGFTKKSQATPKAELELARTRRATWLARQQQSEVRQPDRGGETSRGKR